MDQKTRDRIKEYLASQDGVIRTSDFQKAGLHNAYLTVLVEEDVLVRLKSGLYLKAEDQTVSGFYEIQMALPSAVICLASALAFHELSSYEPPSVHIVIPRDDRTLPPEFPPVRKFSFGSIRYPLGITKVDVERKKISMYDREKTICDSIRYRRVLGQDIVNEAVRKYLDGRETNIDKLIEYSRALKSEGPVQTHLKLMS
ncbi:MAG: type IV toxin-antitoxin system AbiEi family antitoxin domain-containing protein [Spirochaetaceae bacterium]|nr:type IV toxin-antitoxin system AbiEi family antitoxin domain-containing protein [Spirochaetaceae bacterium]MDT8296975.1 type IV toxin-antitoxin system AbiEi family antitoxin domain-containing protein [Spirochaetaceae bacterium]